MTVFISHSSRDGGAVGTLVDHIEAANESVWLDKKLSGGQAWWDEILSQIRSCTVFVVALYAVEPATGAAEPGDREHRHHRPDHNNAQHHPGPFPSPGPGREQEQHGKRQQAEKDATE